MRPRRNGERQIASTARSATAPAPVPTPVPAAADAPPPANDVDSTGGACAGETRPGFEAARVERVAPREGGDAAPRSVCPAPPTLGDRGIAAGRAECAPPGEERFGRAPAGATRPPEPPGKRGRTPCGKSRLVSDGGPVPGTETTVNRLAISPSRKATSPGIIVDGSSKMPPPDASPDPGRSGGPAPPRPAGDEGFGTELDESMPPSVWRSPPTLGMLGGASVDAFASAGAVADARLGSAAFKAPLMMLGTGG